MAEFVLSVFANSPPTLETSFNTAFAALLNNGITDFAVISGDMVRFGGFELQIVVRYNDTGGAINNPYKLVTFTGASLEEVEDAAQAYITAHPAYWFGPFRSGYLSEVRNNRLFIGYLIYNESAVDGPANWTAGGGGAAGPAGGDLSGLYPDPTVVGIQGVSIPLAPAAGGASLVYNSTTGNLEWYAVLVYASLAAAVAGQANQIIGEQVIIYGTPAEDGTYSVTALTGNVADYTKISDATDTASEVSIVDAGNYYTSTDVEGALQEIGAGLVGADADVPTPNGVPTVVDSLLVDDYASVVWEVTLWENVVPTATRERWRVEAVHNGTAAGDATDVQYAISGVGSIPNVNLFPPAVAVALSGAGVTQAVDLQITATADDWHATVRRLVVHVAGAS